MKKMSGYWTTQSNTKQHFSDAYEIGRKLGEYGARFILNRFEMRFRVKMYVLDLDYCIVYQT